MILPLAHIIATAVAITSTVSIVVGSPIQDSQSSILRRDTKLEKKIKSDTGWFLAQCNALETLAIDYETKWSGFINTDLMEAKSRLFEAEKAYAVTIKGDPSRRQQPEEVTPRRNKFQEEMEAEQHRKKFQKDVAAEPSGETVNDEWEFLMEEYRKVIDSSIIARAELQDACSRTKTKIRKLKGEIRKIKRKANDLAKLNGAEVAWEVVREGVMNRLRDITFDIDVNLVKQPKLSHGQLPWIKYGGITSLPKAVWHDERGTIPSVTDGWGHRGMLEQLNRWRSKTV